MSTHISKVTVLANELGYFPGRAQAKKISRLSIQRYMQLQTERAVPVSGSAPDQVIRECDEWAIRKVMENPARFKATVTGTAGDELTQQITQALARAAGKTLRVRIDEMPPTGTEPANDTVAWTTTELP